MPSIGSEYATGDVNRGTGMGDGLGHSGNRREKKGAKGLVRVAVDGVREWVGETGEAMGFWRGDRARRF